MFSNHKQLKRKTPKEGINREQYIKHLVDEYYTTTDVEAQEQVTANLANFAYDPINWNYLKAADALKLFSELLELSNDKLVLHGLAAFNNLCADTEGNAYITQPHHCEIISRLLLDTADIDIIINILALIYQLLLNTTTNALKQKLLSPTVLWHLHELGQSSSDKRVTNLIKILQEDFATRFELIRVGNE